MEKISQSFASKKATLEIFLDLSKAFDMIDHSILLSKLKHYGVRGNALKWFTSYLIGHTRTQQENMQEFFMTYEYLIGHTRTQQENMQEFFLQLLLKLQVVYLRALI